MNNYIYMIEYVVVMALKKIVDGIYVSDDGSNGGNHGAIVLDDEVVMIDSGMIHPKSAETRKFIESETKLPIRKLVFTHSHSDHVFGAQAFEPVQMIASEPMMKRCKENLNSDWEFTTLLKRYSEIKDERPELWNAVQTLSIRLPDSVFQDQIKIGTHAELIVRNLGGHTSGSSIVISSQYNTIFVGDLIFNGQFPYGGDPTCDPDRWILALEEIHALEHDIIVPGHGPTCGQKELAGYIEDLSELRNNVKDALKTGLSVDSFIAREMIPENITSGFERFGEVTLNHWFKFYG
ncbi:MAG: MBL fold metallo-hydrolase [Candidatus Thorarchaeota archaeon]|nr:MAG: MBL fold metallo-hydrolase [Candidatus Thorarchaeota archaeon]